MKQYSIKKITIRFISGGVECTTLSMLRRNFSPYDVIQSYSQLLKWLNQNNNTEAKEIAMELEEAKSSILKEGQESLFRLYSIIFKDDFKTHHISDLLSLFVWWHNSKENETNYRYLREEILKCQWCEDFLYLAVEKDINTIVIEKQLLDITTLYSKYNCYLLDLFERDKTGIDNLNKLFIHLAKTQHLKKHFDFLNKKVRTLKWSSDFFMRIIQDFFIVKKREFKLELIPFANLDLSIETESDTYNFYNIFLDKLLKKEKATNLCDVFFVFLQKKEFKYNFYYLQNVIQYSPWRLDFAYEIVPEILKVLHKQTDDLDHILVNKSFDDYSDDDLFDIYYFFLKEYFKENGIENLEELYLFWRNNLSCKKYFNQLHVEIGKLSWAPVFYNSFWDKLIRKYFHVEFSTDQKFYVMQEKECYEFFKVYFDYFMKSNKVRSLSQLYIYWCQDSDYYRNEACFKYLFNVLLRNVWGVEILLGIYNSHKKIHDDDQWLTIFHEVEKYFNNSADILFQLGKVLLDDFSRYEYALSLLTKAYRLGSKESEQLVNEYFKRENAISEEFKSQYLQLDIIEWTSHPSGNSNYVPSKNLQSLAHTLREKWILIVNTLIHKIIDDRDLMKVDNFVLYMRDFIKQKDVILSFEFDSIENFTNAFSRVDFNRASKKRAYELANYKGKAFLEIRFVFALVCCNYNPCSESGISLLKSFDNLYFPANYLLHPNIKNDILDQMDFRNMLNQDFNKLLKEYCKKMVLFVN